MINFPYVFIDFDGTISNTSEGIFTCVQETLLELNKPQLPIDVLKKIIGPPLALSFSKYAHLSEEETDKAIAIFRKKYSTTGLYMNTLYDGVIPLCRKLRKTGRKVIIATSKPYEHAKAILIQHSVLDAFDYVSGSSLTGTNESKADVIRHAIKVHNISDMSQVVMVGDRKYDIEGAKSFGMKSIGVTWGFGDKDELQKAGANWIADTPKQTFEYLNQS
jgi:phosphoglycolate phosphatase